MTADLVKKHLPPSTATAEGHLRQEYQKLQSTKSTIDSIKNTKTKAKVAQEKLQDLFPESNIPNIKTNEVCYFIASPDTTKAYSDLTGKFPFRSSRGNNYFLVAYHFDANAILATTLKNRQEKTIVDGWTRINNKLKKSGNKPSVWIMDNECSQDLKLALTKEAIEWQLVPPHHHRANLAERAIQTFKAHFKSFLATADPDFPE